MRRRDIEGRVWIVGVVILAMTVGCGPEDDEVADRTDTGRTSTDATADGDAGQIDTDAGSVEAGMDANGESDTDTGGEYACSYFPDSCGEGQNCYPDIGDQGLERVCRDYNPDKSTGDPCEGATDCDSGDRCVDDACREMCDPEAPDSCGSDAVCLSLSAQGHSLAFGVCEPKGDKCTTWPNDDCGEGENCYELPQGNRCLEYDPEAEAGDTCEGHQDCNAAQSCIGADGESEAYCRDKCDEDHPCDSGMCRDISGASYGACIPQSG